MSGALAQTWVERHLAGWPVGLALVVTAVLTAALVVPRAVPPSELPLPIVERQELRQRAADERALVASATREALPYEVRAVGETLRRFGLLSREQPEHARTLRQQLAELVTTARAEHGDTTLLALRALQAQLFAQALRGGAADAETRAARELGGELASSSAHPSWYDEHGFVGSDAELAALFRMRWNELLGLARMQPFAATLNEWRLYYRFLLRTASLTDTVPGRPAADVLSYLTALGELDPDYPIDFARGVALYGRGAYDEAARAFAAHLHLHPDGPWTLRARNHLAACGAALRE
jgi:TolA-binding protein